jgi:hypothetical protein
MNTIKVRERIKPTGRITADETQRMIADKTKLGSEFVISDRYIKDEERKDRVRKFIRWGKLEVTNENTVMDSPNYGIDLLVQWLSGMGTFATTLLPLSYIEIGTGNTTPAITDTALTTPTNRAAVGFQQDYATTDAIVQAIFSDSQLANGTYYEMGTFCGGTSTIGSGNLFNHALFASPYTKSAGTDSTIETDLSFSS